MSSKRPLDPVEETRPTQVKRVKKTDEAEDQIQQQTSPVKRKKRSRWDTAEPIAEPTLPKPEDLQAKIKRLQAETQLRLQQARTKKQVETAIANVRAKTRGADSGIGGGTHAPKKLVLTSSGKLVDESGNVVELDRKKVASLKANKVDEADIEKDEFVGLAAVRAQEEEKKEPKHFDDRIQIKDLATSRKKRQFHFVKPGKHIKKAQMLRYKNVSRTIREERRLAGADMDTSGIQEQEVPLLQHISPPAIEWWDQPYVKNDSNAADGSGTDASAMEISNSSDDILKLDMSKLNDTIIHPVPVPPVAVGAAPAPLQLMLTAKERKKIKRRKREAHQREQQDLIRFGVIPPPEPKLNLKSMFSVIESENIQNPTAFEAKVRNQMKARQMKHEEENRKRQLTDEERKEKKRLKLLEDTSVQAHVAVFRAGDLKNGKTRFKVDISTQQFNLTGCAIIYHGCNCVVVEGGQKGIRKFTNLMLNRIKWEPAPKEDREDQGDDADAQKEEEEDEEALTNKNYEKAILVWKGVVAARSFQNFQMKTCTSDASARKLLSDKNVGHYWDAAKNGIALQM